MRLTVLCAIAFIANSLPLCAEETAVVRAADGFQLPVGPNGTGSGYYIARGYRPNGHLGEDWNGVGGGDTDLGDPVYAAANGYVTFARNYHVGWGNVVILRHAYYEGSELKFVDSLYGHLLDFAVHEGEQVHRGQQIARIGNNFGMYEAHLHFEMRKNLEIGMFRSSFLRDFSNYYTPNEFVAAHRTCPHPNSMVKIPINTYPPVAPPIIAGPHVDTPVVAVPHAGSAPTFARVSPLPPQGSGSAAASAFAPRIVTAVSTPAPSVVTHEASKTANSPTVSLTSTPPPAPMLRIPKMSTVAAMVAQVTASPSPSPSSKRKKTIAGTSSPGPESNTPRISFADNVFETASPNPTPTPAPAAAQFKTGASRLPTESTASTTVSATDSTTVSIPATPEPADIASRKLFLAMITAKSVPTPAPATKPSESVASTAATPPPADEASKKRSAPAELASAPPTPPSAPATKPSKAMASATATSQPADNPAKKTSPPTELASAPSTPTPAPAAKHFKSTASTAATPQLANNTSKKTSPPAELASAPPTPTPEPATKPSKSTASAASTPEPAEIASTKSTASEAVAADSATTTPELAAELFRTIAGDGASLQAPTPKNGTKALSPIAAAPTPTPSLAGDKKTRKPGSPTPAPQTTAGRETEVITADPVLPPPGPMDVSPLIRSGSTFKVDRFEDLRGKGY